MNLQLDSEHVMLRDSAEKLLAARFDFRAFQALIDGERGWTPELWRIFAELGWLGLPFSEEDGGAGGGSVEIAILMEAFGKYLVVEPYLATVVLAGGLIAALGGAAERKALLGPVIAGETRLAFAHDDAGAPTEAARQGGGYVITGAKKVVLGAPMAETLLVSARLDAAHLGVFLVPRATPGVVVRPYRMVNGEGAADIGL